MPTYTEEERERIRREGHEGTIYGIPFAVIRQLRAAAQARNVSPAELVAEATGPERDLADLGRLAREYGIAAVESVAGTPWWMVAVMRVAITEACPDGITYQASRVREGNGYTRAEALALLREKGAK